MLHHDARAGDQRQLADPEEEKEERKGRNPATGEDLMLKPRRVVTFKCSGGLRKKINRGS